MVWTGGGVWGQATSSISWERPLPTLTLTIRVSFSHISLPSCHYNPTISPRLVFNGLSGPVMVAGRGRWVPADRLTFCPQLTNLPSEMSLLSFISARPAHRGHAPTLFSSRKQPHLATKLYRPAGAYSSTLSLKRCYP